MTTVSLLNFWNNHEIESVFVVGSACPAGQEHRVCAGDDGTDLLYGLSYDDPFGLFGTVDNNQWTWDGEGKPMDYKGNRYTRIVVQARNCEKSKSLPLTTDKDGL